MVDDTPTTGRRAELRAEAVRLLDGARVTRVDVGGFGWAGDDGIPDPHRPRELWIVTRMTHCLALGVLGGRAGDAPFVDHGLAALGGVFEDARHGGWFAAVDAAGRPVAGPKQAYGHAFVLLAASSAALAGRPGAADLLGRAIDVVERHLWDERAGALVDECDPTWSSVDPYRGANANMHGVEAFLAVSDATGDPRWLDRALRVTARFLEAARRNDWRLPEHYDAGWQPVPDHNVAEPAHPFRPFGATPGHALEWARLALTLAGALECAARPVPDVLTASAVALAERVLADVAGEPDGGIPYTTDWQGRPVVTERFHWVLCEALAAAWALRAAPGVEAAVRERFAGHWERWWVLARSRFLDGRPGWIHEVTPAGEPSARTWRGRPDVYHALQACTLPLTGPAPSFARAVAESSAPGGPAGALLWNS